MPLTLATPPASLVGFPGSSAPPIAVRVCRRGRSPWWFSNDGSGRFDLLPPDGTCYLATDAFAAIREATRGGPVSGQWVADRDVCQVDIPRGATLAATTRAAAARFGVTKELVTVVPYELPQRWARAFRAHGFGGIRHELRHDNRARPSVVSLFGAGGGAGSPVASALPLTAEALARAGVTVIPIPPADVLTVVD